MKRGEDEVKRRWDCSEIDSHHCNIPALVCLMYVHKCPDTEMVPFVGNILFVLPIFIPAMSTRIYKFQVYLIYLYLFDDPLHFLIVSEISCSRLNETQE